MALGFQPVDYEAMVAFAQRLVRTPSPSTHEGEAAELMAAEMRQVGFEVTLDRMGNAIGRIGAGQGKKLVLDGHLDTVGLGDASCWAHDPYGGEVQQGVLYGRGACDMKGALAAMVYAGKLVADSGATLDGDLYVVGVVQEEPCEGLGIQHVIEQEGLRPDWVVLGEPTNLHLARGQRGRIELQAVVQGKACHASTPTRGVNAIYGAARLVVGLEMLAQQLNHDSFLGQGSIAVTEISSASSSRNAIPDSCTLIIDRRLTTGETEAKVVAEVRRVLTREGIKATVDVTDYRATSYTGRECVARQYFPCWATAESAPVLLAAASAIEDALGSLPHVGKWEFSTDGVYTAGVAGIPTIGFGPGEERYAHTAEEQIRLADIESAARVYAGLALRLLGAH